MNEYCLYIGDGRLISYINEKAFRIALREESSGITGNTKCVAVANAICV